MTTKQFESFSNHRSTSWVAMDAECCAKVVAKDACCGRAFSGLSRPNPRATPHSSSPNSSDGPDSWSSSVASPRPKEQVYIYMYICMYVCMYVQIFKAKLLFACLACQDIIMVLWPSCKLRSWKCHTNV